MIIEINPVTIIVYNIDSVHDVGIFILCSDFEITFLRNMVASAFIHCSPLSNPSEQLNSALPQ